MNGDESEIADHVQTTQMTVNLIFALNYNVPPDEAGTIIEPDLNDVGGASS